MQSTNGKPFTVQPRFNTAVLDLVDAPARREAGRSCSPSSPTSPKSSAGQSRSQRSLVEALAQSRVYRQYAEAFTQATGLPLTLRPAESWQLPFHGKRHEAPYCAVICQKSRGCAACLQMQERLTRAARLEPHTEMCPAGLCETAVPVRLGDRLVGFLQTGQVSRKQPTQSQFKRTATMLANHSVEVNPVEVKEAYFATRVMPQKQQDSAVTLLRIFAQHLSMLSNQVVVQQENAEPPVINRAKAYIQEHLNEDLRLGQVAKAVNVSTFYFCKIFKQATGINFTDYLARMRIEKAKNLLLNPNLRVSEIAFEVGFQSLTHFNRIFKKVLGESPTNYRANLMGT